MENQIGCEGCSFHPLNCIFKNDICGTDFQDCTRSSGRLSPSQLAASMFEPGCIVHKVLTFGSSTTHAAI